MRRLFWIVCLLCVLQVKAQFDPVLSHSWSLQSYYNPAAAGLNSLLDVKVMYSKQMMGFEDSPSTILLTADLPVFFLGPSHGIGAGFMNDKVGIYSTKQIYLQYAYHLKLWGGRLSAGVRPVFLMENTSSKDLDIEDAGDPAFATSDEKGYGFDIDAGLRYTYKNIWYAGASAMHLMNPTIKMGDAKNHQMTVKPMFHAMGGYRIKLRYPQYAVVTHAQVRTDLQSWRADIHARMTYNGEKHKLYAGLNYSPLNSVGVCLGYNLHGVNIGYSYEMYTGGIGALNGTHEVMIGYETELNFHKKGKNLHKSVRLL